MSIVNKLKQKVLNGDKVTKKEALELYKSDYMELTQAANEIRKELCTDSVDLCSIINGKSGKCSENCTYCA